MKQLVKTPLGPMSYAGDVHLDMDMKGKHLDLLVQGDENAYESTVLSILADLMDEDPWSLTQAEMYYYFLLCKMTTLGPVLDVQLTCDRPVIRDVTGGKKQAVCGHKQVYKYSFSEADVKYVPEGYVLPKFSFTIDGEERTFFVRPPRMADETALLTAFQEEGYTRLDLVDIEKHLDLTLRYARERFLLFLVNEPSGTAVFANKDVRQKALKALMEENGASVSHKLTKLCTDASAFGVDSGEVETVCEECGGKLSFHLPLSAGISL